MARFDRCVICDYNESEGSSYANIPPFSRGKVALYPNIDGYYCETCAVEQHTNLVDLTFTTDPVAAEERMARNYRLFRRAKEYAPEE